MSLRVQAVSKSYGTHAAVREATLEAGPGEFVVLLGPSGCGKSTLLRVIAGLERPDSGAVFLDDRDVTTVEPQARDVAMVFQNYALYPHMTVRQNIAYPLRVRKRPGIDEAEAVVSVAGLLGLSKSLDKRPRELSGGERQRVALARAIVRRPRAFLMDEPLSNLDTSLRVAMRAELKRLHRQLRIVTVYVTHDQTEAMTLADRIAVMRDGAIVQYAAPMEIYRCPADIFVASFVGSPAMNLIPGKAADGQFRAKGPAEFCVPTDLEGDLTCGVRPEDIELSTGAQAGWCPCAVTLIERTGSETLVYLTCGSLSLTAQTVRDVYFPVDARIWLQPRAGRILWFDRSGVNLSRYS